MSLFSMSALTLALCGSTASGGRLLQAALVEPDARGTRRPERGAPPPPDGGPMLIAGGVLLGGGAAAAALLQLYGSTEVARSPGKAPSELGVVFAGLPIVAGAVLLVGGLVQRLRYDESLRSTTGAAPLVVIDPLGRGATLGVRLAF